MRTTKSGHIRLLEERITRLEEEVRMLTSMMKGAAPTVPIIPWKLPFVYTPANRTNPGGVSIEG